jgi:hypothetical protein
LFKGQFKINGGNKFCGTKEKKIQEKGNGTENESPGRVGIKRNGNHEMENKISVDYSLT